MGKPILTDADRVRATAFATTFDAYRKVAPSPAFLDDLERRLRLGHVRSVRQWPLGVYSWVDGAEVHRSPGTTRP
jgi:hypothetical protein